MLESYLGTLLTGGKKYPIFSSKSRAVFPEGTRPVIVEGEDGERYSV